jgi:hypothetical protein
MSTTPASVVRPAGTAGWPVPAALVALSAIPLTAGTLRPIQLAGGPAVAERVIRRPARRRRPVAA